MFGVAPLHTLFSFHRSSASFHLEYFKDNNVVCSLKLLTLAKSLIVLEFYSDIHLLYKYIYILYASINKM